MLPCLEPHELHQLQMGTRNLDGAELCSPRLPFQVPMQSSCRWQHALGPCGRLGGQGEQPPRHQIETPCAKTAWGFVLPAKMLHPLCAVL